MILFTLSLSLAFVGGYWYGYLEGKNERLTGTYILEEETNNDWFKSRGLNTN